MDHQHLTSLSSMSEPRIAYCGSPVWMINLPLIIRSVVVVFVLVVVRLVIPYKSQSSALAVEVIFVAFVAYVLFKVMFRVAATACMQLTIDSERLTWREGVVNRRVTSVELYRIQNVEARIAWWQRLGGFGTLIIESSDAAYPIWILPGIPQAEELREALIRYSIAMRDLRGVREINTGRV